MTDSQVMLADLPAARESGAALPDRASALFNAMLTEHFVLQSVRGVTVSESSSRAALYMTTLSGALVAYGFLADTNVEPAYLGVVLPIVFLLGVFTWERLVQTRVRRHHRCRQHPADPRLLRHAVAGRGVARR